MNPVSEFWTHIELAVLILSPIAGGLWVFFNKLTDHAKEDMTNFGKIDTSLARFETKLDAMWDDWKKNGGTK